MNRYYSVIDLLAFPRKSMRLTETVTPLKPLEAMAQIGIGIDNFSITPAAIGPVKAMIRSLDADAVRSRMDKLLAEPPRDMRKTLTDWAKRHKVALG